jgi:hypothetical protein
LSSIKFKHYHSYSEKDFELRRSHILKVSQGFGLIDQHDWDAVPDFIQQFAVIAD